jgi:hypothetical protein
VVLSAIFKHGPRELLSQTDGVSAVVAISTISVVKNNALLRKLQTKLVQRMALV